jgi:hypothetical protein
MLLVEARSRPKYVTFLWQLVYTLGIEISLDLFETVAVFVERIPVNQFNILSSMCDALLKNCSMRYALSS